MKNFQSLTKTVEKWRQVCSAKDRQQHHSEASSSKAGKRSYAEGNRDRVSMKHLTAIALWPFKFFSQKIPGESKVNRAPMYEYRYQKRSPISLVLAVICLTGAIGTRFYNQPKLAVGTPAPRTIMAPSTARFPDRQTTEEIRRAAQRGSIPILKIDFNRTEQIQKSLERYLNEGDRLRQIAGVFPFTPTQILSESSQLYLRTARPWEWLTILAEAKQNRSPQSANPSSSDRTQDGGDSVPAIARWALSDRLLNKVAFQAVAELKAYRQQSNPESFDYLIDTIIQARQNYPKAIAALSSAPANSLASIYAREDRIFFNLSDDEWEQTKQGIQQTAKLILTQGIPIGLPSELLENAIKLQIHDRIPLAAGQLGTQILLASLKPNLVEDFEATSRLAKQAAEEVKTVYVNVEAGEIIVEAGEIIDERDLVLLDGFGLSQRGINWIGLITLAVGVSFGVGIFWFVEHRYCSPLRRRDRLLILLLTLSVTPLLYLNLPITSLPAIGLLMGNFYGSTLAATTVALVGLLLPAGMEVELAVLLANISVGLLGGIVAGKMRAREELALLGLGVGLVQAIVYLIITLILSANATAVWYTILLGAALQGLIGVAWSVIALGVSPYLEQAFDLITPIRLAELSNLNRPLLKRLAAEAPGTFQHTLFVSSLAEAAGKQLNCNVELIRAGTLYHDIGKMHDPLGFIENQMGGPNKHDRIDDPWKSARIIQKHVTQGIVMAKRARLPKALQAFIPEHQGTMLIAYFYHQAQQRAAAEGKPPVPESEFRYAGPIPQSRETAIVMLADSCEAALRSLKDATPEEALNMVNKIFRARWQDNQLVDSGLRREDMPKIADIFVQVWQQFNHKRIAYPKAALQPQR